MFVKILSFPWQGRGWGGGLATEKPGKGCELTQFVKMIDTPQPEGQGKGCLHSRAGGKSDAHNTERDMQFQKVYFFLKQEE